MSALLPAAAGAYVGSFDPSPNTVLDPGEPQLVTIVDSNAAPIRCIQMAGEAGDVGLAAAGLIAPIAACANWSNDGRRCRIVAPVSRGAGQVIAVTTLLASPDAVLGHEFRHCADQDFHPALLPFAGKPR